VRVDGRNNNHRKIVSNYERQENILLFRLTRAIYFATFSSLPFDLDYSFAHFPVVPEMAYLTPESESSTTAELSWTQLIPDKPEKLRPIIGRVTIDDKPPKEMNPDEVQLNSDSSHIPRRERRESLMGTFHRHLRMSLKAVSESPGPLTR
jgi:hypothetical protein